MLPPVGAAQQPHHCGGHRRAFSPGHAIKVDGSPGVQAVDRRSLQGLRYGRGVRNNGHANIGFEQFDKIALRPYFVAVIDIEAVLAERGAEAFAMFAIVPRQPSLRPQILKLDIVLIRKPVMPAEDKLKIFRKQWPDVEPLPRPVEFGCDAKFASPFFSISATSWPLPRRKSNSSRLNSRLIRLRNGISSVKSIDQVKAILSAPTSPLLKADASDLAPTAAS
jgi:hypothetical protein